MPDAYKSILEGFIHAGTMNECQVKVKWILSDELTTDNVAENLSGVDGILVAPGFGQRGIEGKLTAIKYIRENNIPFFGICLGMQCAVIEYARNVLGIKDATSAEMETSSENYVIDLMEGQKDVTQKGGTMRLGSYPCTLKEDTTIFNAYGTGSIEERHRHRYEFNNAYLSQFEEGGMIASGINPTSELVEVVEVPSHPFFVGTQYHPEYKSTVMNPHPLFVAFVKAALTHQNA